MLKYKNLTIIGTSHISPYSIQQIELYIKEQKPDIIALELDKQRLQALSIKKASRPDLGLIKVIGLTGFLFTLIGSYLQKKLGQIVGVIPGSEMLIAIELAKKNNIKVFLIDQNVQITLRKLTKNITKKEKFRFLIDLIKAPFVKRQDLKFDIRKVPPQGLIKKIMKEMEIRYPNVYFVLIADRNQIMASKLKKMIEEFHDKKILCIMGAGHLPGIKEVLNKT